jgi:hypothetical protein
MTSIFGVNVVDFNEKNQFLYLLCDPFTLLFSLNLSIFLEFLLASLGLSHHEISLGGPSRGPPFVLPLLVFGR